MLAYGAVRGAAAVAGVIPPNLAYPVLDCLGDMVWLLDRRARRAVEGNLLHVVGAPGARWREAVRRAFRHGARNYYDTFRVPRLSAVDIGRLVPVRGWEHLDDALRGGRGVILVTGHISSVAMTVQAFAARGHTVTVPVEPIEPPELLRYLSRLRAGRALRLVPLGPRLGTDLTASLGRNELVGLAVDRDVAGSGVVVPFFGAPARLPVGPALLSLRTGAPILVAVAVRRPDDRFAGVIEPPLRIERSGSTRVDAERITRAIAGRLEYYIGKYPEQWTVFQPVWREVAGSE